MVGALSQFTEMAFQLRGVELLENIFVEVTLVILAEQIKNIGWKQKPLVEFDGAWLESRIHGIITTVFNSQIIPQVIDSYIYLSPYRGIITKKSVRLAGE